MSKQEINLNDMLERRNIQHSPDNASCHYDPQWWCHCKKVLPLFSLKPNDCEGQKTVLCGRRLVAGVGAVPCPADNVGMKVRGKGQTKIVLVHNIAGTEIGRAENYEAA